MLMLTRAQREAHERDGFSVVPNALSSAEIVELRAVTEEFVRSAATVTANLSRGQVRNLRPPVILSMILRSA